MDSVELSVVLNLTSSPNRHVFLNPFFYSKPTDDKY